MNVLIACEYSGTVRDAFIARGHNAWSCDLLPTDKPGPHYQGDVFDIINEYYKCKCGNIFPENYGKYGCCLCAAKLYTWDMMIAFPPCTHLAVSGAKHFKQKRNDGRQQSAIDFFLKLTETNIPKVCIENPVSIMSRYYRKPDQIINPWYFGETYQKSTCLWLNGLPKLFHAKETDLFNDKITHVGKGEFITTSGGNKLPKWYSDAKVSSKKLTQKIRSKTFQGIADAMADQWSKN